VPIDTAKQIIPQLKQSGRVDRGYLGIQSVTVDKTLKDLNLPVGHGALVQQVTPDGPAAKAGIRAGAIPAQLDNRPIQIGGDIIIKVDGTDIRTSNDLQAAVVDHKPGDKVKLTLWRDGKVKTVEVTLAERPNTATNQP
jgi:S1-C subfamily serine protease